MVEEEKGGLRGVRGGGGMGEKDQKQDMSILIDATIEASPL